ncbi:MAG: DUF6745 domain-containing protein [Thermaurantimonas sp.]
MIDGFRAKVLEPLNRWILENELLHSYQKLFNNKYKSRFINLKNQRNLIAESLITHTDILQSIRNIPPHDYFSATYIEAMFMHFLKDLPDIDRLPGLPGLFLEICYDDCIFLSYFTLDHAIVLRWPEIFETTDDGVLHNPHGPALVWGEERYYFYSGWKIPAEFYERVDAVSPGMVLGEKNVEKRRAYMEILGSNRFAELLDLEIRDQSIDRFGNFIELYRTRTEDTLAGEHLQFVKVTCPSTGRNYMLCVPPHLTTAREAVAWTFGKRPEDYNPTDET